MLAFIDITLNAFVLAGLIFAAAAAGFLLNSRRTKKLHVAITRLEAEMLKSHAEILQLQKELSEKENASSKTPIFSIRDNASDSTEPVTATGRTTKKSVSGGSKSGS